MGKKALVTGALGHTGSILVCKLVELGWDVIATDLTSTKRKEVMKKETVFSDNFKYPSINLPGVKLITADLTDKESLKALFTDDIKNYDVIFHPASLYDYFADLDILRRINVDGERNLLEVIFESYDAGKYPRFIHWSTCGVYGEPEYKHNSKGFPIAATEEDPYSPPNNYSISKMEQELVLKELGDKNSLKWTIVRSAPIYGPYQTYGAFHIFYMLYKFGHMVLPIIYPKKKKLMMPMVHVYDVVNAAIYLSSNDKSIGETYNVIGDTATEEDWMEFTFQELGIQYTNIPIWWPLYKVAANIAFKWAEGTNVKAKKYGVRPTFDLPMAGYILHQYFFSNKKIKDLGYKFEFDDPFKGTRQTLRWYVDSGWFEAEKFGISNERVLESINEEVA